MVNFEVLFKLLDRYGYMFVEGVGFTLMLSAIAVLLGLPIGALVAIMRMSRFKNPTLDKFNPLKALAAVYVEVLRGTPLLLQLYFFYFLMPALIPALGDEKISITVALIINSSAYVAEIVRSGIMSVEIGQFEAGRSLGLNYRQTMTAIILPQAVKNILPALLNEFISLLKETSISGYIGLMDLTKGGDIIRSNTYEAFLPLIAVAIIYLLLVMMLSSVVNKLERKLRNNER